LKKVKPIKNCTNYSRLIKKLTMKKILLLALLVTTISHGFSQITIESTDFGQIGDEVLVVFDSNIVGLTVNPASSSSQTFDYSSLSFSSTDNFSFLDPASSIGASDFPNANLLLSSGGGTQLRYWNNSVSSLELDGVYGDPYGIGAVTALDFTPNVEVVDFPANYGDMAITHQKVDTTLLDTISGLFDSLRLVSNTEIVSSIDAFGTLNLPNLSESVLRKYDIEVRSDTIFGLIFGSWQNIQESTSTRYFYRFLAKNKDYYVLETEADMSGNIINTQYQVDGSLFAGISNKQNISCFGSADGTAEVLAIGGTSPYTYSWSNGQSGSIATGLAPGAFTVVVTDAANDTYSVNVDISEPDLLEVVSYQIGADHGFNDGFIEIETPGGTPSFSYLWSNGETSKNISNLTFGTYSVTVTDASGCIANNSFDVDDITSIPSISSQLNVKIYPNPVSDELTINSSSNWTAILITVDGRLVRRFVGFGDSIEDVSGIEKGVYILILTTDNEVFQTKLQVQ
jgi:hypothetical protein